METGKKIKLFFFFYIACITVSGLLCLVLGYFWLVLSGLFCLVLFAVVVCYVRRMKGKKLTPKKRNFVSRFLGSVFVSLAERIGQRLYYLDENEVVIILLAFFLLYIILKVVKLVY